MRVHYLEIVATDVDAVCSVYAAANKLQFGEPVPELGNARTATTDDGSVVGVRAPMHDAEEPVIRPYWLVDDLDAAVAAVAEAGGTIAVEPMEIPGRGRIALYMHAGTQHGLWQI